MAQQPQTKNLTPPKIDEVKSGFVVLARTGGRDFQIIAVTENLVTAQRLAAGKSTPQGPYLVEPVPILMIGTMAYSRVQLIPPSLDDLKSTEAFAKRAAVVEKALALGLTQAEIDLL